MIHTQIECVSHPGQLYLIIEGCVEKLLKEKSNRTDVDICENLLKNQINEKRREMPALIMKDVLCPNKRSVVEDA